MKINSGLKAVASIAILSALFAAPIVSAQSGSRLCGYVADVPPGTVLGGKTLTLGGKIGLMYECRDSDASYHTQCDKAVEGFKKAYEADPVMKSFNWVERKRNKCEDIGVDFTAESHPGTDMCDAMEAKQPYSILKIYATPQKTAKTTLYTKM